MKKFILITLIVIFSLLLIAGIGGYIFLKNFDIKKYKPQIIEAAQKALNRTVNFADINLNVSLKEGIRMGLSDFTISEDPAFGQEPFFSVSKVDVGLDLLSFLNAGRISLPNILIATPTINIIRNSDGKLNAQTIGSATPASGNAPSKTSPVAAIPAIFIKALKIENAQINFIDKTTASETKLSIDKINLNVNRFSLTDPFDLKLTAAIFNPEKNLDIQGKIQLKLVAQAIKLSDFSIATDFGTLDWAKLKTLSYLQGVPLPETLKGQLNVTIKDLAASDKGVSSLSANAQLSNGEIVFPNAAPGISLDAKQLNLKVENLSLNNSTPAHVTLQAALFNDTPNVNLDANISLDAKTSAISLKDSTFTTNLDLWSVEKLKANVAPLKDLPLPQKMSGALTLTIKMLATSAKGIENLLLDADLKGGYIILDNIVPNTSLAITHTDLNIQNFSFSQPFTANLKTALFNDQPNISFNTTASVDLTNNAVSLKDGKAQINLDAFSLPKLKISRLLPENTPLPDEIGGVLDLTLKDVAASAKGLTALKMDLNWQNGKLVMKQAAEGIALNAQQINLFLSNFSLKDPFFMKTSLAYESDVPNVNFEGNVQLNLDDQNASVSNGKFTTDLSQWNMARLKTALAPLAQAPLPDVLAGKLEVMIKKLSAGAKGISNSLMNITLTDGVVKMAQAAPGIAVNAAQINLKATDFSLENSPFALETTLAYESETPNINLVTTARIDLAHQSVQLSDGKFATDLSLWNMERLKSTLAPLAKSPLPDVLKGKLNVTIKDLSANAKGLQSILADIALGDGTVKMNNIAPGISFAASQIQTQISNFSLSSPFTFDTKLAYLNAEPNVVIKGSATLDIPNGTVFLKDFSLNSDLGSLDFNQMKSDVAALAKTSLPEKLTGKLNIALNDATFGPKGPVNLVGLITLQGGSVKLKELAAPLQGLDTTIRLTSTDISADTINATLGKGTITAQFNLNDYAKTQNINTKIDLKNISIEEILDQSKAPVKLTGIITGNLKAQGPLTDLNSLTGDGTIDVTQATLKDLNVLKTVLDKMAFIPNASERIKAKLPEKYLKKLEDKDTQINKVAIVCVIANGLITLDPTTIEADEFIFHGKTEARFDQHYTLDGSFMIPAELSAPMAQGVPEFEYLYDESNNISFPVHIIGQGAEAPTFSVEKTAVDMTKKALINQGKKELNKVLNKYFGGGNTQTPADQTQPASDQQPNQSQQDQPASSGTDSQTPTQPTEVIKDILGTIFK